MAQQHQGEDRRQTLPRGQGSGQAVLAEELLPEKEEVDQDVELEKAIALIQSRGMYVSKPGENQGETK